MAELFKTVLVLSFIGFALILVLLCLKPLMRNKFPAFWYHWIWVAVLFCMTVPIYKFIPDVPVANMNIPTGSEMIDFNFVDTDEQENVVYQDIPVLEEKEEPNENILSEFFGLLPIIWLVGALAFFSFAFISYLIYLCKKRKNSVLKNCEIFETVKKELGIRRKIPLYVSSDITSPVLAGVLFPKVYIPERELDENCMRMVFLHELTHYKRRDLILKQISLFVNAVHWFNPLSYVLCRNISDSCEVSCDVAVTKNMTEQERKLYMKTILDFAG